MERPNLIIVVGKMIVLMALLDAAAKSKEKLLLFSQSLVVLELIERCLNSTGKWKLGRLVLSAPNAQPPTPHLSTLNPQSCYTYPTLP